MTTLIELLEQAESDINTYAHPSIEDAHMKLSKVTNALGLGSLSGHITSLSVLDKVIRVEYEWSCRGCHDSDTVEIPREVIESDDPVHAASILKRRREIALLQMQNETARRSIDANTADIAKLFGEVAEMEAM